MKVEPIANDLIDELLASEEKPKSLREKYPIPEQNGPLRFFDNYSRCASRGCSSPTHYKVSGVPYCSVHALRRLNEMLIKLGVER